MAGASVEVKIDDHELQAFFAQLSQQTDDMSDIFADIGEILTDSTHKRFEAQIDPEGKTWVPLLETTWENKERDDILIEEGFLMSSFLYEESADALLFGSNMIYAATHQFGDDDRNIPARPFLGISGEDELGITNLFVAMLQA